jgi:hypothetical protein
VTYYAGMGPRLVGGAGIAPHVVCDKCRAHVFGETKSGRPTAWLRKGTAPRGWLLVRIEASDATSLFRRDYCKACRSAVTESAPREG